jgi:hypothetical protein
MLSIHLERVPNVLGIYGASGDFFPKSASLLHPEAARDFARACVEVGRLRVSDMLRTAEQSLEARERKSGVQPPGFSAHNFGLAVDLDVERLCRDLGLKKVDLDARLAACGWYCHRKDGLPGSEWWHFNHLGTGPQARAFLATSERSRNTSAAVEARIVQLYGAGLRLSDLGVQECLARAGLYRGALDGILGPRSKQAMAAFQRAWNLEATGIADARTQRTLALVTADLAIAG